jgi:uncharacterized protein YbcV (DUF1398 family)
MVVKKTTTKTAATKKTTAKKTTTAKPATKTTATKTTVAKKTTTASKSTTSTTEISVTGNKKVSTLKKEFNAKFPYLSLGLFRSIARLYVKRGEPIAQLAHIDDDKTLAYWRNSYKEEEYIKNGSISISGNKKIKNLEKEFDTAFGLYCQICYTGKDGSRYYTSSSNEKTLAAFNAECEKNGCKKGQWK